MMTTFLYKFLPMSSSYVISKFRSIWQINIIKTFEVSKQLNQISSIAPRF